MSAKRISCGLLIAAIAAVALPTRADVNYQPYEFSAYFDDARPFEKWDEYDYDREPYARTGLFVTFQMGQMIFESPEPTAIGAAGISRPAFYGNINFLNEFNSLSTGAYGDTSHEMQDTTFGYIEKQQGWLVRWLNFSGRNQVLTRSDAGVIFNDPENLLIGFYDLNGDGVDDSFDGDLNFGRDGGLLDAGDLVRQGVQFGTLTARLNTNVWSVEGNYLTRLDRELCGAYWESFAGVRFMAFDERFDVEGLGGVLSHSFWNTRVQNRLVGPQIGLRWFRTDGRFTFSTESRAMLFFNFQTVDQTYGLGSQLTPLTGRGTDPTTAGQSFFRTRFDRFQKRTGENNSHDMEIGPLVELSAQASFAITKAFSIEVGVRGMYIDGLGRPAAMVDYTFPTFGINEENNHQRMFAVGGYGGINFNR